MPGVMNSLTPRTLSCARKSFMEWLLPQSTVMMFAAMAAGKFLRYHRATAAAGVDGGRLDNVHALTTHNTKEESICLT